jgi:hypothetical protein
MAQRAAVLAAVLLVGLVTACAGQRGGADPDAQAPATTPAGTPEPAGTPGSTASPGTAREWRSDGCATPRSPVMISTAGTTFPAGDERVNALIDRVRATGESSFGAVYAGVEVVPEQVRMVVYRKPSAEFDAYLRGQAGGECMLVRDAAHSQAELVALADRISADMAYWRGRGIAINTVGPRHDGSGVEVGTQNVTAAEVELPRRYGPAAPIKVVDQGPVQPLTGAAPG